MKFSLMKNMVILLALLLSSFLGAADTLSYYQGTYDELLAEAARSNKPVMLYFHFEGCGACLEMEKDVLADQTVYEFYNSEFLVFSADFKESKEIKDLFGVQFAPTFIYLNPSGEVVHKLVGIFSVEDFIRGGKVAMSGDESLLAMEAQYESGNRNAEFLFSYCCALRDAAALDSAVIRSYIASIPGTELYSAHTAAFVYEFSFVNLDPVFSYYDDGLQVLLAEKREIYAKYDSANVENRILYIVLNDIYKALREKNHAQFEELLAYYKAHEPKDPNLRFPSLGSGYSQVIYVRGLSNLLKFRGLFAFEGEGAAMDFLNQVLPEPDSVAPIDLIKYAMIISGNTDNPEMLQTASEWMEQAIAKQPIYVFYAAYARFLFKLEKYEEALVAADKAIELGLADDYSVEREEKLREDILAKMDETK